MILSRQDIDGLADQIIRDFQQGPATPFPSTDIDRLAEQYLGLRVFYDTLSTDGSLLGVTAYDAVDVQVQRESQTETYHLDRDTVLLEKKFLSRRGRPAEWERLSRQRAFTLAHECSHQIIFRLENEAVKNSLRNRYSERRRYDCRDLKAKEDWNEWQANTLGAALLMPRMYIDQYFAWRRRGQPLVSYQGKYPCTDWSILGALASWFGVSRTTVKIRLKDLGYLIVLPRECFYDPIEIYCDSDEFD